MKIALIGNQNSGKTTLFNLLTDSNSKVGNWPGVTIERRSGIIKNTNYELVDLPGVYSLSPFSNEEKISRNYILEDDVDLIINIVDATSLERSLYLTTQLLELDKEVLVVLNMSDKLAKKKQKIDEEKLAKMLGCQVISISALKNIGLEKLIESLDSTQTKHNKKIFGDTIEEAINQVINYTKGEHERFLAIKLLEKDPLYEDKQNEDILKLINELEAKYKLDSVEIIASKRYEYIENIRDNCLEKTPLGVSMTDKIDKVLLNKYFGIPIFIVIMFLVYFLSVGIVGSFTVDIVEELIGGLAEWASRSLESLNASPWATSLVSDGIIMGVGAVLSFLPQLAILFLLISFLESSGYMARISFLLDKFFKRFGLSGKSLIPFIVGSGCSVPGIMATRTIEDDNERKLTIMLTPFIPCSAKLPIIALFSGYFFKNYAGIASASLYFLSIITIIVSAILLRKFVFKGEASGYLLELPEYSLPNFKHTFYDVYDRVASFVKQAGTLILFSSMIIWFLTAFSFRLEFVVGDIERSMLAFIGKGVSWLFYPMLGELSWGASVSAIQGLIAKEQVVSSMVIISNLSSDSPSLLFSASGIFGFFTPASAYAFMVFNLFSAPCLGTIAAMKKEYNSGRVALKAILFQTAFAWVLGVGVYWLGVGFSWLGRLV